ncbi:ATP-dependent Clp protease proteolytic subunit [uncultured Winogradskyella sp.]|uniref:ATP-dependent Clp protease proteolytic subunit n=1 Tax=uncultured Winogradskyella sp. TaxID=395353 RepID=UPI0030EDEE58
MPKEILLYSSIYEWTAESFIERMSEYASEDIDIRVNSNGGDPISCWGMLAKMKEHSKVVNLKVDGSAYSMAAFMVCYADNVSALDVSEFMFHRASFGSRYEMEMELNDVKQLKKVNDHLREAFEAKINVAKFEKISGVTVDQLFSIETRIDVYLDAEQALEIGLIDSIEKIQPKEMAALHNRGFAKIAAEGQSKEEKSKKEKSKNNKKMTLQEFKTSHPEIHAQAMKEGMTAERDRVGSWMAYSGADMEAVKKGITDGEFLSLTAQSELNIKMLAKKEIGNAQDDSAGGVDTKKEDKELTAIQDFEKKFDEGRKSKIS